jgi:5'-hydroxyaverantin dehydrogenase
MEAIRTEVDLTLLKGKSALITGGASGIGLATARTWAAAGVYVTIADIQSVDAGQNLVAEISSTGNHVNYAWCDVTSWESQIAVFKSAIAFSPTQTLDIVATFAGTAFVPGNQVDHVLAAGEPSLAVDPKQPDVRNIEVNLTGVYYTSWLALYYMRLRPSSVKGIRHSTAQTTHTRTDDKSLIFVSSIGGYMDSPKASTYPASKFGVRGLFRSTRARTLDIGVRCNLLAPWFIDTPLIAPIKNAMAARGIDMGKVLSFASIESCVEAATFCAVDPKLHGTLSHSMGLLCCSSQVTNSFFAGRALAIQPEGIFDLKDDFEDGWAGDQLRPIIQRRRDAGFDA